MTLSSYSFIIIIIIIMFVTDDLLQSKTMNQSLQGLVVH